MRLFGELEIKLFDKMIFDEKMVLDNNIVMFIFSLIWSAASSYGYDIRQRDQGSLFARIPQSYNK